MALVLQLEMDFFFPFILGKLTCCLFLFLRMDWGDEYSHNSFDLHCLLNSLPGELEFKQIFSDIDEKIEQNATR